MPEQAGDPQLARKIVYDIGLNVKVDGKIVESIGKGETFVEKDDLVKAIDYGMRWCVDYQIVSGATQCWGGERYKMTRWYNTRKESIQRMWMLRPQVLEVFMDMCTVIELLLEKVAKEGRDSAQKIALVGTGVSNLPTKYQTDSLQQANWRA